MHETEIKLRAKEPVAEVRSRLRRAGFSEHRPRAFEANLLLDTSDAQLRGRREVLRLREFDGEAIITYKGPSEPGTRHKSREEIETRVSDGPAVLALFDRLGFRPTYRYEKYRTEYGREGEPGVVTLDETPIGVFLEIEGEGEWIDTVAGQLGFGDVDYITDSYATLYRRHCEEHGLGVGGGMVFSGDLSCS